MDVMPAPECTSTTVLITPSTVLWNLAAMIPAGTERLISEISARIAGPKSTIVYPFSRPQLNGILIVDPFPDKSLQRHRCLAFKGILVADPEQSGNRVEKACLRRRQGEKAPEKKRPS